MRTSYLYSQYRADGRDVFREARDWLHFEEERAAFLPFAFGVGLDPGPMLAGFLEGMHGSITGQIAVTLARNAIIETVLAEQNDPLRTRIATGAPAEFLRQILAAANRRVYDYGRGMLAGNQLGSSVLLAYFDADRCTVARAGAYECFLCRGSSVIRFFNKDDQSRVIDYAPLVATERTLGRSAELVLDIASVSISRGDRIVLTSLPYTPEIYAQLQSIVGEQERRNEISNRLALASLKLRAGKHRMPGRSFGENAFVAVAELGLPTVTLRNVVEEPAQNVPFLRVSAG